MRANIVRQTLLCAGLGMIAVSAANADVLDIVTARSSVSTTLASSVVAQVSEDYATAYPNDSDPLVVGNTEDGGWYLTGSAGANKLSTIRVKDVAPDFQNFRSGLDNVSFATHWGTAVDFTVGYELQNWVSVEVQTGLGWNALSGMSGDYIDGVVVPLDIVGGSGDLYQIPLVANLAFDLPIGNSSEPGTGTLPGPLWNSYLSLFVGAGLQYNLFDYDSLLGTFDGNAFTFRYQFGAALNTQVAYNITLGAYFRYSGSSGMDLGTFTTDLGLGDATVSIDTDAFHNLTMGINLRIDF